MIEDIISDNKLDFENPFIVALCDAIQSQGFRFDYDYADYNFENAVDDLGIAMDCITDP